MLPCTSLNVIGRHPKVMPDDDGELVKVTRPFVMPKTDDRRSTRGAGFERIRQFYSVNHAFGSAGNRVAQREIQNIRCTVVLGSRNRAHQQAPFELTQSTVWEVRFRKSLR